MSFRFQNRAEAGRLLADKLQEFAGNPDAIVLGLPRGGVPVAAEVAQRLNLSLDIFLVRKLGAPGQEELAFGAIASGGVCVLNPSVVADLGLGQTEMGNIIAREEEELERREAAFGERAAIDLRGRVVILIDDGLATGASMRAAVMALRQREPKRIVVAVPVAAAQTVEEFAREFGEIVFVEAPRDFSGVGQWYVDFTQTTDEEVRALLAEAKRRSENGGR